MTPVSDPKIPLSGAAASAFLTQWITSLVVRLALWVTMLGALALLGYGRGLRRPMLIGLAMAAAGAMGLGWAYHESKPKKPWTMPVPTDPKLPINCPSCGLS